jgi:hypothetical protein
MEIGRKWTLNAMVCDVHTDKLNARFYFAVIDCGEPTPMNNMNLTLSATTVGSTAVYACSQLDIHWPNTTTVTCMPDASWSPQPQNCTSTIHHHVDVVLWMQAHCSYWLWRAAHRGQHHPSLQRNHRKEHSPVFMSSCDGLLAINCWNWMSSGWHVVHPQYYLHR